MCAAEPRRCMPMPSCVLRRDAGALAALCFLTAAHSSACATTCAPSEQDPNNYNVRRSGCSRERVFHHVAAHSCSLRIAPCFPPVARVPTSGPLPSIESPPPRVRLIAAVAPHAQGNTIKTVVGVMGREDCCIACKKQAGCVFWTWGASGPARHPGFVLCARRRARGP